MSQGNEQIVRSGLEALAAGEGGVDSMLEFVHPDFEMVTPPDLAAEPGVYRGHEGVRRWFDSFSEAMDQVRVLATDLTEVEGSDDVVAMMRLEVRGRTTGLEVAQEVVGLCTVSDSKMWRLQFFTTREQALAAAGQDT